jgi:methionyl-tRNA synthetase
MLKAMGVEPYQRLHVHGYWNVDETKMSKSIGNVVRPLELVEDYGVDTVRHFVLRDMSFGLDSSFSDQGIVDRRNADLANDLGNLFSRSLTMIGKYSDAKIPEIDPDTLSAAEKELQEAAEKMVAVYRGCMDDFAFNKALMAVWELVGLLNRYIVTNAPWELAKDPADAGRLRTVLYHLAEGLRIVALVLRPVMPQAAGKMASALGLGEEMARETLAEAAWGTLPVGTTVNKGEALFPRLEKKKKQQAAKPEPAGKKKQPKEATEEGLVTFDQFGKLELRVAKIVAAERVKKSDRLLQLSVKAPEERTVVAGIAQYYQPEELIGKLVIIVANLKPAKLMGVTSQGMVLAAKEKDAEGNERLVLSTVSAEVAPGSRVA